MVIFILVVIFIIIIIATMAKGDKKNNNTEELALSTLKNELKNKDIKFNNIKIAKQNIISKEYVI